MSEAAPGMAQDPASVGAGPTSSSPPSTKHDLIAQILVLENAIERIGLSEDVATSRGMALAEMLRHERDAMRQTVKTLMLLKQFERQFVAMVQRDREGAKARTFGRSGT